jgi:integrase
VRALEPSEAVDLWRKLTALSKMSGETVWAQRRAYAPTRIHPYLPDLVLWMLGTSQRLGQALAVHWPWIDLERATTELGPNVIRVKGEGLRLNYGTTKTRDQVLDLPEPVVAMLRVRRDAALNPLGPVFPDGFGGLQDPHNTLGDLRRALDMAGYEWVTSHTFRKTREAALWALPPVACCAGSPARGRPRRRRRNARPAGVLPAAGPGRLHHPNPIIVGEVAQ